tara:strand:+ start:431 stop:589 length:159 start_codon:yes stop_codon:yes gene_type:complete
MLVVVEATEETKVLMAIVPVLVVVVALVDLEIVLKVVNLDATLLAAVVAVIV